MRRGIIAGERSRVNDCLRRRPGDKSTPSMRGGMGRHAGYCHELSESSSRRDAARILAANPASGRGACDRDRRRARRSPARGSSSSCSASSHARSASSSAMPITSRFRSRCAVAFPARRGAPRKVLVAGLAGDRGLHALECRARRLSCRRRMEMVGRAAGLRAARSPISAAPATCSSDCETINIVRCDEVPWRFLGLSLAGYNVLISLALAAVALWGARAIARSANRLAALSTPPHPRSRRRRRREGCRHEA